MKLSVWPLLVLPLILLFCCHCFAELHGKVDADNQHSIYKINPRCNALRSDLKVNRRLKDHFLTTNSSRADFLCPKFAAILPCTCTVEPDNKVVIDCTFVESVDQLVKVFQQDFPVRELHQFTMSNNGAIKGFPSFMNGITFESVFLYPGPFVLADISEHFLFDLKDTLKQFMIYRSNLTTDFFPFFMLPLMNQLEDFSIHFSEINGIPQIRAPSLTYFALDHSPIGLLENGTFPVGTGPMTIWVHCNQIHTIEVGSFFFADQNSAASNEQIMIHLSYNELQSLKAGTFCLRDGPTTIDLTFNLISSIEPGTFVLPASTGADSKELITIDLAYNQMQSLKTGTFPLGDSPMSINLFSNQITSIEPGTFVLPASTGIASNKPITISLANNQLQSLMAGTFPLRSGPMYIYLNDNQISSIEPGTFVLPASTGADYNEKIRIDLYTNQLQSLQAGTFPLRNGRMIFFLSDNQISSIEPGTFVLPASTDSLTIYLQLVDNELTTFDEAVFGSMMPFMTHLYLYDNPLTCGCDMAWLIMNESFLATVDEYSTCANGTNLHDLDPQQYIDFC